MPVRDAGLWQDPPVCSQTEQVTRLAATDAAEPPLEPVVSRSVSYGLQVVPPHEPRDAEPRKLIDVEDEPTGLPLPALYSLDSALAYMIAPLLRSSATIVESFGAASIA